MVWQGMRRRGRRNRKWQAVSSLRPLLGCNYRYMRTWISDETYLVFTAHPHCEISKAANMQCCNPQQDFQHRVFKLISAPGDDVGKRVISIHALTLSPSVSLQSTPQSLLPIGQFSLFIPSFSIALLDLSLITPSHRIHLLAEGERDLSLSSSSSPPPSHLLLKLRGASTFVRLALSLARQSTH